MKQLLQHPIVALLLTASATCACSSGDGPLDESGDAGPAAMPSSETMTDDAGQNGGGTATASSTSPTESVTTPPTPTPTVPTPTVTATQPPPNPPRPVRRTVGCPGTPLPLTSQLPLLGHAQYDRTVRDLLGVTSLAAAGGAAPSHLLAVESDSPMDAYRWEAYRDAARAVAAQVVDSDELRAQFINCDPDLEASCYHDTIIEFGRRAFRRPMTDEEIESYERIVDTGRGLPSNDVTEALIEAFLLAPSFLTRAELDERTDSSGNYVLSPHEVAARLSYMFWGSMPDEELSEAADAGRLATVDQVYEQAQRLFADRAKSAPVISSFNRYYLRLLPNSRWTFADKDPELFPEFSDAMLPAMVRETEAFMDRLVLEGGMFQDIFLDRTGFVNADTAHLYGLDPSQFGEELTLVELDGQERPGVLTRAAFLSGFAYDDRPNPILRGSFILEQILNINVGDPPPAAVETPSPPREDFATEREWYDAWLSERACVACHTVFINPYGFALGDYDAVGQLQTVDSFGGPIDTNVELQLHDYRRPVSGALELMQVIANAPEAQRHYASRWVEFAYRRRGYPADECVVEDLANQIAGGSITIDGLFLLLTQSEQFMFRTTEDPRIVR